MSHPYRELVDAMFEAVMAKDLERILSYFADDAVFEDPHYPTPRMVGRDAIRAGLSWGLASLEKFGFTIERFYLNENGSGGAVEVATAHVVRGNMKLNFPQAFFFDVKDRKLTRLQAYEPYGPHGIGGVVLAAARLKQRLTGRA